MTNTNDVRDAHATDIPVLEQIIRAVGLFTPEEASGFAETLPSHFGGSDGPTSSNWWLLAGEGAGAAYLAPEPSAGVWNLLFLGVRPEVRRRGIARALVAEVERRLRLQGARMLLIDTSTSIPMAAARELYAQLGYEPVAQISDYWAPGDGKLTFRRML